MIILGLNAYHGDSAACIVIDGKLIAAAEEERFRRVKHWAGFPTESIKYCLREAGCSIDQVDHVAHNRSPYANITRKVAYLLIRRPSIGFVSDRLRNATKIGKVRARLAAELESKASYLKAKVHGIEHHLAHLGSAFYVSPFERAAVVSVDGSGDFVGAMWGIGEGNKITVKDRVFFPNSLGLFYLAITQFLGFPKYGDEYKVMGLSSYGHPAYLDKMRKIVLRDKNGRFRLDPRYFLDLSEGATMSWESGEPSIRTIYSPEMENELGVARKPGEDLDKRHEDLAASLQAMYEEAFFELLNHVHERTGLDVLCLAGGCAMNSVANGKIFDRTAFKEVYIQPAAGDSGGAIGAAYHVWNDLLDNKRDFVMNTAYWGPQYSDAEIGHTIEQYQADLNERKCEIAHFRDSLELCKETAREISLGRIVGWFQGRMEWGPRALGNRSIVVDPRRAEMKDVLNSRIKRREPFRPFAPSILLEKTGEYFEEAYPDPFMIKVYPVRQEKRSAIPAVTHVDGSGRLQTVRKEDNPLYWQLIKEFGNITGIPVVLNTSFNENEPIVCTPKEALECFLRTKMDVLVLGNTLIRRNGQ